MATMEKVKSRTKKKKTKYKSEERHNEDIDVEDVDDANVFYSIENNADSEYNNVNVAIEVKENLDTSEQTITQVQKNAAKENELINLKKYELIEVAQDSVASVNNEKIKSKIQECEQSSQAIKNVQKTLPSTESSYVAKIVAPQSECSVPKTMPTAPTYKELSAMIDNLQLTDYLQEPLDTTQPKNIDSKTVPFSFQEIENIFGTKEINLARQFAIKFEEHNMQAPSSSHPLYDALLEYQRARSVVIHNKKDVSKLTLNCKDKEQAIWVVRNTFKTSTGRCSDGTFVSSTYRYKDATFEKEVMSDLQKDLSSLRTKVTEVHSNQSHMENFLKMQVDDIIWTSIASGLESIKDSLKVLFWVIRTSGWGFDKLLRRQLRNWCCLLAEVYLKNDVKTENILYILHHLLRVPQGIRWGLHLIQCDIKDFDDIHKALCLLEAILMTTNKSDIKETKEELKANSFDDEETDSGELVIAADALDDSLWLVVDSDGENVDIETSGGKNINILRESDVLGLLKQIPFEKIFKTLMVIGDHNNELLFCGNKLSGGAILKVFAFVRLFLNVIRYGLQLYKKYQELTKELCRLALHSVIYCTDLWEINSSQCEANLVLRLTTEYNNVFMAGVSTLECAGSREISTMFISDLPFRLCWDHIVIDLYKNLIENLIVSDSIWCYYTLVTFSNMIIARNDDKLISTAVKKLFEIGYLSDFSDLGCGEWARSLCGEALKKAVHFIGPTLNNLPSDIQIQWLDQIPLQLWKPQTDELIYHLNSWKEKKITIIPHVLKSLNWNCDGGIDLKTQQSVALYLSSLAQSYNQPKNLPPEWIWECLLILKLHHYEWNYDIDNSPHPESLTRIDLSGKCLITSTMLLLMTSWGHSVPLIFQHAAPILVKLANAGRFTEVVHIMYYIIPILSENPISIGQSKNFKELLSIISKDEKTYTKMATRLVIGDFPSPYTKLLINMMRSHIYYYKKFSLASPSHIVAVWINWLTSIENWQSDWVIIHLLDVVISSAFFHYDAMSEASNIFSKYIQLPTSPKSPTSSNFTNWFWNNSSAYKGLVQCSMEAPYVWYLTLWIEHNIVERSTGLWQKLLEKLSAPKDGSKVNIDKTLKSVGGGDNSAALVIYRVLQCAINTPVSHPILTLLWQLFFYLFLDVSFLLNIVNQPKPLGPLFFQGLVNSKILARAKARLIETKNYHEGKAKEVLEEEQTRTEERKSYHTYQAGLMNAFHLWLDENFFQDYSIPQIFSQPFADKMSMLIGGQNATWMETIDLNEFNKNQPTQWPFKTNQNNTNLANASNNLGGLQSSRCKFLDLTPVERIIQTVKTYERPIKSPIEKFDDFEISPLFDPSIIFDLKKLYKLMETHLKELTKHSKMYYNTCQNLNSIDEYFYNLLPKLYEKHTFCKSQMISCEGSCKGGIILVVVGKESILADDINNTINVNRRNHQIALNKAMESYKGVALHTAIINKIAQLTCNGSVPNAKDVGDKLFNDVLNSLKGENLQFPPASYVLNCVATQLGEKFIRVSGAHCISLLSRIKEVKNEALVCSLLRPLELPNNEMLDLYSAVSTSVTEMHVAFSCLSKFRISAWLRDFRPSIAERNRLLALLCEALGSAGCEPPSERLILQELLCVHLGHVLAWEFPNHLNQVLSTFYMLTLEKRLPPDCWEHCFTVIEKYPHLVTHQQACTNMESFGRQWWTKRGTWGLHGLYDRYSLYAPAMARLGALFSSTVLNTSMIHQPLLLTHQICSVVFNTMCAFWNVWLIPRWDATEQAWTNDFSRSLSLMPWGPDDADAPEIMLNAFVETLLYCMETLPGSANDFLRLSWQWYTCNYAHVAVGPYILARVHKALSKLPWSVDLNHWITFSDLQTMSKISSLPLPPCHAFILHCLGERKWQNWINDLPPPLQNSALHLLLPLLVKLQPETHILHDVLLLPWEILSAKQYEDIVKWFMTTIHTPSEPFYSNKLFPLICVAGGLKSNTTSTPEGQAKKVCIIREWVNTLSFLTEAKMQAKQKSNLNKEIGLSVLDLLKKIENTTTHLVGVTDIQKTTECTILFNGAIMMHNFSSLQDLASQKWLEWMETAPKLCIEGLLDCLLNVTQKASFSILAEHCLNIYFKLGGEWNYVMNLWKNNCIIPVNYLLDNGSLIAALATYKSSDMSKYEGKTFELLDIHIIQSFLNFKLTCSNEREAILWIFYMISLIHNSSIGTENQKRALSHIIPILEKWSQGVTLKPLWKHLLMQNPTTDAFQIVTKYAYIGASDLQEKIKIEKPNVAKHQPSKKVIETLENLLQQKSCTEVKHIIEEYVQHLNGKNKSCFNFLKSLIDLSSGLYADTGYITKASSIFTK